MTQAFNLAQLANKVNTSGQLDASSGLVNAVPVANGGLALNAIPAKSIPLANVANTYTTLTPGASQSIRINAGNTAWEAFTPGTGTVTSVATGNGLSGGTITSTGTLVIAAPTQNTVGAYAYGIILNMTGAGIALTNGNNYSAGAGSGQVQALATSGWVGSTGMTRVYSNSLSGTWKYLGPTATIPAQDTCLGYGQLAGLFVRVS